jgi:hypothetical protein
MNRKAYPVVLTTKVVLAAKAKPCSDQVLLAGTGFMA